MSDKLKHFAICFAATLIVGWRLGVSLALGKELWDEAARRWPRFRFWIVTGTGFDILDLLAGLGGVGLALLVRLIPYKELGQ